MNIHEYQGKSILQAHGVPVQEGFLAETAEQAKLVAEELQKKFGTEIFVIKAQIHAGGRGKGGGVKIARSPAEAAEVASKHAWHDPGDTPDRPGRQNGTERSGRTDVYYKGESDIREFYMSVLLDRKRSAYVIMYSTEGGMDIEEVAEKMPEAIFTEVIDSTCCLHDFQMRTIAFNLGLKGKACKEMTLFHQGPVGCLYRL